MLEYIVEVYRNYSSKETIQGFCLECLVYYSIFTPVGIF